MTTTLLLCAPRRLCRVLGRRRSKATPRAPVHGPHAPRALYSELGVWRWSHCKASWAFGVGAICKASWAFGVGAICKASWAFGVGATASTPARRAVALRDGAHAVAGKRRQRAKPPQKSTAGRGETLKLPTPKPSCPARWITCPDGAALSPPAPSPRDAFLRVCPGGQRGGVGRLARGAGWGGCVGRAGRGASRKTVGRSWMGRMKICRRYPSCAAAGAPRG